jgi:hypothetical protein
MGEEEVSRPTESYLAGAIISVAGSVPSPFRGFGGRALRVVGRRLDRAARPLDGRLRRGVGRQEDRRCLRRQQAAEETAGGPNRHRREGRRRQLEFGLPYDARVPPDRNRPAYRGAPLV